MDTKKLAAWSAVAVIAIAGVLLLLRPAGTDGVVDVSPSRAAQLAAQGVRVVDVRTPGEYETGRIPGAENVPMDGLPEAAAGWDRSEPLLVYCATGVRSTQAVQYLKSLGFETIHHLSDGIVAWTDDLERDGSAAARPSADARPTTLPVMYEFFTGW